MWWSLGEPQTYSEELVELFPFLKEGYLPLSQVTFLPPENPEQKDINLKTVGNCLFAGSKITTISVPYTIKEVNGGDTNGGMLTDCHFLTSVTLEDGMTKIPERLLLQYRLHAH